MLGRDLVSATGDLQGLKVQFSNRAREKDTKSGTREELWRWTSRYPNVGSVTSRREPFACV